MSWSAAPCIRPGPTPAGLRTVRAPPRTINRLEALAVSCSNGLATYDPAELIAHLRSQLSFAMGSTENRVNFIVTCEDGTASVSDSLR